jgi:hypothetical protein
VTVTKDKGRTYIQTRRVTIEHTREVRLLHFFFEAGYMLDPPESTMCLYSSTRTSNAAFWIVSESISAMPACSMSTRYGWTMHSGASNQS